MTIHLKSNYQSSYLFERDPGRFEDQSGFINTSNQIIQETAEKIAGARKNGRDLKELFFEIINELSLKRASLTKSHPIRNGISEYFGQRRDQNPYSVGLPALQVLGGPYKEYGDKILDLLSEILWKMEVNGEFKKEYKIEDVCDGRISRLQIEVLTSKDLINKGYTQSAKSHLPDYIPEKLFSKNPKERTPEEAADYRKRFARFKNEFPQKYRCLRINSAILNLNKQCPSPSYYKVSPELVKERFSKENADMLLGNMKSLYVHATLRTNIDGKLYTITEYLTWMYENHEWQTYRASAQHPIKRMKECSNVMLIHQDVYLIEPTLVDISKIFERAVAWNKDTQTLQELKNTMAHFCYLSSHNMRDMRGSAAQGEWLEQAIYLSHEVEYAADKNKMVDLEAFGNMLFSNFKKAYDQMVHLKLVKV